jgi:hypothetical protein
MRGEWIVLIGALIGALGGAAIGAGATLRVTWMQQQHASRAGAIAELKSAGLEYFAAADRLANQYAQLPPVDETGLIYRLFKTILGERGLVLMGRSAGPWQSMVDHWEDLTDDFLRASARFSLVATPELQASIEAAKLLITKWSLHTGLEHLEEWRETRRALSEEFRAALEDA